MGTKQSEDQIDSALADDFAEYMKRYPEIYRSLAQTVHDYLPSHFRKPLIVDVGAGPGLLLGELHCVLPDADILGIDPSRTMLTVAHRHINSTNCESCHLIQARAEHLPFPDESISIIVSRLSLCSWACPREGVAEMFRVLKPGGRVVLEGLNREFPRWRLCIIKLSMFRKSAEKSVIAYHSDYYKRAFSLLEAEQLFLEAGFHMIKKEGKRNEWKFLLIGEKT